VSHVTNVILTFQGYERRGCPRIPDPAWPRDPIVKINAWLGERNLGVITEADTEKAGGTKGFEAVLFWGGFNYLPLEEFLGFIGSLPWLEPENVQVFVKPQHADRFELYTRPTPRP
jgi:hypothetical protein